MATLQAKRLPDIFIAADGKSFREVQYIEAPQGTIGIKINLDYVTTDFNDAPWATIIDLTQSFPIFLDMKMNNGARTIKAVLQKAVEYGVRVITVMAHVGVPVLRELQAMVEGTNTMIAAVGVLTHYDDEYCQSLYNKTFAESTRMFAEWACAAGIEAFITPATQLQNIVDLPILKITPGVRPVWAEHYTNQLHIKTPEEAYNLGADCLVIGRPITQDKLNPHTALKTILCSVKTARRDVEVARTLIGSGAVEIRDVEGGEQPFIYSSGNQGPGYIMIKGLVGQPRIMKRIVRLLAEKIYNFFEKSDTAEQPDFIEGNVTGGMVPGWELCEQLADLWGMPDLPFVYMRQTRKIAGHGELITGDRANPRVQPGMCAIVVEELVNYAQTTCNAATVMREKGYQVDYAATLLAYDHQSQRENLQAHKLELISLITLPRLLDIAANLRLLPARIIQSYHEFLDDPIMWQVSRGLPLPYDAAEKAKARGFSVEMFPSNEAAIAAGAPAGKLEAGFTYFKVTQSSL